ncbi:MAG TPA: hypothetical protein PLO67_08890, partial [Saprospiraceae bacterium]|nr:hypothetical protein [Saprospiraceae bacterium]
VAVFPTCCQVQHGPLSASLPASKQQKPIAALGVFFTKSKRIARRFSIRASSPIIRLLERGEEHQARPKQTRLSAGYAGKSKVSLYPAP